MQKLARLGSFFPPKTRALLPNTLWPWGKGILMSFFWTDFLETVCPWGSYWRSSLEAQTSRWSPSSALTRQICSSSGTGLEEGIACGLPSGWQSPWTSDLTTLLSCCLELTGWTTTSEPHPWSPTSRSSLPSSESGMSIQHCGLAIIFLIFRVLPLGMATSLALKRMHCCHTISIFTGLWLTQPDLHNDYQNWQPCEISSFCIIYHYQI